MMRRDQLQAAAATEARLQALDQAIDRAGSDNLKTAFLYIQGPAHGTQGIDGRMQQDESRITLDRVVLLWILEQIRQEELANLEALGVEIE